MDTFLGRYRNLLVLAAILFAQIIGLALQVRRPTDSGETRLICLWAVSAVTPIESAVIHTQEWVKNLWTTYIYLHGVRRENRELRAEIAQMKIEETRLAEDARMARRIQSLLAFKEQYIDSTIAAQVIGTSGSEQSRVLYIDKGSLPIWRSSPRAASWARSRRSFLTRRRYCRSTTSSAAWARR
jgi:rod shape-determining protein MreC